MCKKEQRSSNLLIHVVSTYFEIITTVVKDVIYREILQIVNNQEK
jgi:hypothetical protein